MIVPRLRSEARGGPSTSSSSNRYNSTGGVYGGKIHHSSDPELKRALQSSYTSQAVRKWEKRWVTIHETSMRVHKWMPAPVTTVPILVSQIVADNTVTPSLINKNQQQEQEQESLSMSTQDTQMIVDEESISQSG